MKVEAKKKSHPLGGFLVDKSKTLCMYISLEGDMTDEEFEGLARELAYEIKRRVPGCDYDFGIWIEGGKSGKERVRVKFSFLAKSTEEKTRIP